MPPDMARMQLSLRMLLLLVAIVAVVLIVAIDVGWRIDDLAANGYRLQDTGDLLIDYYATVGNWPKNWDDLRHHVETHKSEYRYDPNVNELQRFVRVDFDFVPDRLDTRPEWSAAHPPLIVVSSRYGRTAGATRNPNYIIYAYLRGDLDLKETSLLRRLKTRDAPGVQP